MNLVGIFTLKTRSVSCGVNSIAADVLAGHPIGCFRPQPSTGAMTAVDGRRWSLDGSSVAHCICGSKRKEKMTLSPCPLVQMGDALLGQLARVLVLLAVQLAPAMAKSISWDYSDEEMGPLVPVRASRSSRTLDTKPFDGVLGPCRNGAASPTPTSSTGARAELISPSNKETNPGVVEGKSL